MNLRKAVFQAVQKHPEFAKELVAELRKSAGVKTVNAKFKLSSLKVLEANFYENDYSSSSSGKVAMSGTIGLRVSMGFWSEWGFRGIYEVAEAPSGDVFFSGPKMSNDSATQTLLHSILEEELGSKVLNMMAAHSKAASKAAHAGKRQHQAGKVRRFRVPKPVTREQAAKFLADELEEADYDTKIWTRGDHVRIYLHDDNAGKKHREAGYVEIKPNGEVSRKYLTSNSSSITPAWEIVDGFEFDLIPEGPRVDFQGIAKAVRRGDIYSRFSEDEIQAALAAGFITKNDLLNQDT